MSRLAYVSHDGERVELDSARSCVGQGLEIRGRAWKYDLGFRTLSGLSQTAQTAELRWACSSPEEADRAAAAFDRDAEAKTPGMLVSDGWERPAYCVATKPRSWHAPSGSLEADITFALLGQWRKYEQQSFTPVPPRMVHGYPHTHPHTYGYAGAVRSLNTRSDSPSRARITVFGPVSSPRVQIGGNTYSVAADVPSGAYMVIDGLDRTVKTVMQDGTVRDDFARAERGDGKGCGSYVFEDIEPGEQPVSWAGTFGVEIGWWKERTALPWKE